MIEKRPILQEVADAIAIELDGFGCQLSRDDYRDIARAAIGRLRDPSAQMLHVGASAVAYKLGRDNSRKLWQAMIDHILKGGDFAM